MTTSSFFSVPRTVRRPRRDLMYGRLALLLFLLLGGLSAVGCAHTPTDAWLAQVPDLATARAQLGAPSSSTPLADGTVRHEWLVTHEIVTPGQYVTRRIRVLRDDDGFPRYVERTFWVPEQRRTVHCRVTLLADAQGRIVHAAQADGDCAALLPLNGQPPAAP